MVAKVAVVTGANRGLGLGTAEALARQGYRVVLTSRELAKAGAAAEPLRAAGLAVDAMVVDVADDASVAAFYRDLDENIGRIDVLVNNAGMLHDRTVGSTLDVPASLILETINNNALSAWRMSTAAIRRMGAAGGRIVNVSSGMGSISEMGGGFPAYRTSKSAMNALTRVLAHEAGPAVKINAVCPGWVKTDMGGEGATRELATGVASIVWAATLPDDGPTGGFFRDGTPIAW